MEKKLFNQKTIFIKIYVIFKKIKFESEMLIFFLGPNIFSYYKY